MEKTLPIVGAGFVRSVMSMLAKRSDLATCPLEDVPGIEGQVWAKSASRQVRDGMLRAVRDGDGSIIGYEHTRKAERASIAAAAQPAAIATLDPSGASITVSEMDAYAGRHFKGGKSRTKGLSEFERATRRYSQKPLTNEQLLAGKRVQTGKPPMEDAIERVERKVATFHTQRHTNDPLLMETVRAQFHLMNKASDALGAIQ